MINIPGSVLYIFSALDCEAKPLVRHFGLKKESSSDHFTIYRSEKIVLTVTGVGKVVMAAAVAYTMALFQPEKIPVIVNIGISGHKTKAVGSLLLATKIIDEDSGKKFYPQLVGDSWPEACEIRTASLPCTDYAVDCAHDMEASAFYEIAVRFSSSEVIHCIKIISDNEQYSVEKIQSKMVSEWIADQIPLIDSLLKQWIKLRNPVTFAIPDEYNEIINQWHFTVTGQAKLKGLLVRWNALSTTPWLNEKNRISGLYSGKDVLKKLELDLNNLDVYL